MGRAWIDVGIVLILLVVGGLFTSTELALVSLRVGQLKAIAERAGAAGGSRSWPENPPATWPRYRSARSWPASSPRPPARPPWPTPGPAVRGLGCRG